jgi:hypothetical protein
VKRLRLEVTANFETNLDAAELHQPASLLKVLVRLEEVTRLLRRQPHVGRP